MHGPRRDHRELASTTHVSRQETPGTGYFERPGLAAWASYHPRVDRRATRPGRGRSLCGVDVFVYSAVLGGLECDEERVERRAEC